MEHDDTPKQMLSRVMLVGQLLIKAGMGMVKELEFADTATSSNLVQEASRGEDLTNQEHRPLEKHNF
jgi:hypothetical protein